MRTIRLLVAMLIVSALAAGCSSAKTPPAVLPPASPSGSTSGPPSVRPSEVAKGAADAKQACAAFEQLIGYLGDTPVKLDQASQAVSTMTISAVGANGADSQRWQKLSDDVLKLLGSVTTGGSFNNPAADDPEVMALRQDCT
ncbi:MAG: hypothetical protein M3Y42_15165 [Actinomycetota bacterium]|nr:hypothetical protein [Actinomycetota bacterium]MDQ2958292.1 hypothetical protein [Actinomycetota bacterium]